MKSFLKSAKYLLFLAIGAGLLWLSFRGQSFESVWHHMKKADPWWLLLSVVLSLLALISRAMRWRQLMEPMGYRPRLITTFHAVMFGYLANYAIPRLGEISRCGALNKSDLVPFDKLIGTVIVERIADVLMLVLSIMLIAVLESEKLGGFMNDQFISPALNHMHASPALAVVAVASVLLIGYVVFRLFSIQSPPAFIGKIKNLFKGIGEGLRSIKDIRNKPLFIFHSVFIWTIYMLMTYVCFFSLPETSGLGIGTGLFITVLGGLAMTAPVQGGIGTYHLLVSQGLILYGLSATDGLSFATLVHTVQTLMMISFGAVSMIILFFFTRVKDAKTHGSAATVTVQDR